MNCKYKNQFNMGEYFMKMIKMDAECKKFFKNTQRLSDLINGVFLNGNNIINEDNISLWDSEETFVLENRDKQMKSFNRYRDTIIKMTAGHISILIALENQSRNDFHMALRAYQYDSMNYIKQWDTDSRTPEDRTIIPMITFVIHWGEGVFSAKRKISDMTEGILEEFKQYFNEYQMNFRDIKEVEVKHFQNKEVKNAIKLIQSIYKTKRNNYKDMLDQIYVNKEILEFVSVMTNIEELYKKSLDMKEEEEINMCEAFQEFLREGREEGRAEGRVEVIVDNVKKLMEKLQISEEESMNILDVTEHERLMIRKFM